MDESRCHAILGAVGSGASGTAASAPELHTTGSAFGAQLDDEVGISGARDRSGGTRWSLAPRRVHRFRLPFQSPTTNWSPGLTEREAQIRGTSRIRITKEPGRSSHHARGVDAVSVPVADDEGVADFSELEGEVGGSGAVGVAEIPGVAPDDAGGLDPVAVPVTDDRDVTRLAVREDVVRLAGPRVVAETPPHHAVLVATESAVANHARGHGAVAIPIPGHGDLAERTEGEDAERVAGAGAGGEAPGAGGEDPGQGGIVGGIVQARSGRGSGCCCRFGSSCRTSRPRSTGGVQVTTRHTMGPRHSMWFPHCPYRNSVQLVFRLLHEPRAHWQFPSEHEGEHRPARSASAPVAAGVAVQVVARFGARRPRRRSPDPSAFHQPATWVPGGQVLEP